MTYCLHLSLLALPPRLARELINLVQSSPNNHSTVPWRLGNVYI